MSKAYQGELEKERKQLILEAAVACVTEDGIDGATLKKVAAKAKVSTGMIAYYFHDKNELMIETISGAAAQFRGRLTEQAGAEPGMKRLKSLFDLSFPSAPGARSNWPFWLEYAAHACRNEDLREQLLERLSTIREDLRRCCSEQAEGWQVKSGLDPEVAADMLLVLYHGMGVLTLANDSVLPSQRMHQMLEMVFSLLKANEEAQ